MELNVFQTGPLAVNSYVVELTPKNVFVVDPADCAFSGDRFTIINYLNEKKLNPAAVILTHGHFDHVSGLKDFKTAFPNVPVLIHQADKDFIGQNSLALQKKSLSLMDFEDFLPSVTSLPEPTEFLQKDFVLGDLKCFSNCEAEVIKSLKEWKILHTPGHTKGSVCLYNQTEKKLLSGDCVFYHSYGRTDLPSGDENEMQDTLRWIYKNLSGDTKVYPGHDYYGFNLSEN